MPMQILKEHGSHIAQSAFDTKAATATVLSAGSAATAISVEGSAAMTLNDFSIAAAIFAASCTGIYMLTNIIINVIKIRRELNASKIEDNAPQNEKQ